jgi:hypothetical protein
MSAHKRKQTEEAEAELPDDAVPYAGPAAIVLITASYADRATARWLTSPYALEQPFCRYAGRCIPDN